VSAVKYHFAFSLLLAFLCFSCAPERDGGSQSSQTLNVLNGRYPSDGSLIRRSTVLITGGKSGDCTGSVLSSKIILTAGHCVSDVDNYGKRVLLPTSHLSVKNAFKGPFTIGIDKILMPKEFYAVVDDNHYDYGRDIALLRLSSDLPSPYVPVVIEKDLNQVFQQTLQFAGYGDWELEMRENDSNMTNDLAVGQIRLKDKIQMSTNLSIAYAMKFNVGRRDSSPCHGDSGGPIYYEKDGQIRQVAVMVGIEFAFPSEKNLYRCGIQTSNELGSTVFGANSDFLNNGYRELTGASLL
jgi:secreted trypsin-like serine protease